MYKGLEYGVCCAMGRRSVEKQQRFAMQTLHEVAAALRLSVEGGGEALEVRGSEGKGRWR